MPTYVMEDLASAGAGLTARASEETTNFSRVVCMLFDLGPTAMKTVMEAHLPGENTVSVADQNVSKIINEIKFGRHVFAAL